MELGSLLLKLAAEDYKQSQYNLAKKIYKKLHQFHSEKLTLLLMYLVSTSIQTGHSLEEMHKIDPEIFEQLNDLSGKLYDFEWMCYVMKYNRLPLWDVNMRRVFYLGPEAGKYPRHK